MYHVCLVQISMKCRTPQLDKKTEEFSAGGPNLSWVADPGVRSAPGLDRVLIYENPQNLHTPLLHGQPREKKYMHFFALCPPVSQKPRILEKTLKKDTKKKKNIVIVESELALKSIPHPGIFGGFGRNVFFLQYGDFIKKPEVLILLSKTTT